MGVFHEHIFFDDGTNIGYGNEGVFRERDPIVISEYSTCLPEHYDDDVMKESVEIVGRAIPRGKYTAESYFLPGNYLSLNRIPFVQGGQNCQNFVTDVLKTYQYLTDPKPYVPPIGIPMNPSMPLFPY